MTDRREEMIGKLLHHLIDAHNRIDSIREALVKARVLSADAIELEYRNLHGQRASDRRGNSAPGIARPHRTGWSSKAPSPRSSTPRCRTSSGSSTLASSSWRRTARHPQRPRVTSLRPRRPRQRPRRRPRSPPPRRKRPRPRKSLSPKMSRRTATHRRTPQSPPPKRRWRPPPKRLTRKARRTDDGC